MSVRRTRRQRNGADAEDEAARYVEAAGWRIVGRNVRIGRDEIDIVAVDPDPPAVVVVEVRGLRATNFGAPEERVDRLKVARLYRAMAALRAAGDFATETGHPSAWRVDLIVVDHRPGRTAIRHLRALEPPG